MKIQGEEEMTWMPTSIELAKIESVKIHTQNNDILATGNGINYCCYSCFIMYQSRGEDFTSFLTG